MSVDPVRAFLARKHGLDPSLIESYSFVAQESRIYSEYTMDDFSCRVRFTVGGEMREDFWPEDTVAEFLEGLSSGA